MSCHEWVDPWAGAGTGTGTRMGRLHPDRGADLGAGALGGKGRRAAALPRPIGRSTLLPSCSIDSAAGAAVGLGEVFRRG
jgi:hypothetical protein